MDEGINNILLDELFEAHGCFENIISEMKEKNIEYPYESVINLEESSYRLTYNAINKMEESQTRYNYLCDENKEFFSQERKIIVKFIALYIFSIIVIKVFSKTLSSERLNEIWYALFGIVLGSINATIINKNINNYRYGSKNNRELMNTLTSLKEEYDENFEIARREVSYLFSLNHNLEQEINNIKVLKK